MPEKIAVGHSFAPRLMHFPLSFAAEEAKAFGLVDEVIAFRPKSTGKEH